MERFITLNLQNPGVKAETENPSKPADKEPEAIGKNLNRSAWVAGRKPIRKFGQTTSGIFSK
jgi:hypothetical protein